MAISGMETVDTKTFTKFICKNSSIFQPIFFIGEIFFQIIKPVFKSLKGGVVRSSKEGCRRSSKVVGNAT